MSSNSFFLLFDCTLELRFIKLTRTPFNITLLESFGHFLTDSELVLSSFHLYEVAVNIEKCETFKRSVSNLLQYFKMRFHGNHKFQIMLHTNLHTRLKFSTKSCTNFWVVRAVCVSDHTPTAGPATKTVLPDLREVGKLKLNFSNCTKQRINVCIKDENIELNSHWTWKRVTNTKDLGFSLNWISVKFISCCCLEIYKI